MAPVAVYTLNSDQQAKGLAELGPEVSVIT